MPKEMQLKQQTEGVVARAIKAMPFIGVYIERLNDERAIIDSTWQNYHDGELEKKRIAKKAINLALEKFWGAARDQARKELKRTSQ